eukprot:15122369-Alexandrium_andersonii.AAC.1
MHSHDTTVCSTRVRIHSQLPPASACVLTIGQYAAHARAFTAAVALEPQSPAALLAQHIMSGVAAWRRGRLPALLPGV